MFSIIAGNRWRRRLGVCLGWKVSPFLAIFEMRMSSSNHILSARSPGYEVSSYCFCKPQIVGRFLGDLEDISIYLLVVKLCVF